MAGKKPVDPLKAKEARQKKIAIGGAVLLLIVLVVQVPKMMKQLGHSTAPPPQPAATVAAPSTPGATTPTPGATPTTPDASGSSTGTGSLLSATAPTAAIGQFSSFAQFGPSNGQVANRDPFAGPSGSSAGGATTTSTTPTPPKTPPKPPTPPTPPTTSTSTSPANTYTAAQISVNGVKETVQVGGNFPSSSPFFHLVSVSATSAKISIAGGSLANGAPTVTLEKGKALTLMNTTDGTRYKIVFVAPGAGAGGGASSTGASTTAAGATTAATTTTG